MNNDAMLALTSDLLRDALRDVTELKRENALLKARLALVDLKMQRRVPLPSTELPALLRPQCGPIS